MHLMQLVPKQITPHLFYTWAISKVLPSFGEHSNNPTSTLSEEITFNICRSRMTHQRYTLWRLLSSSRAGYQLTCFADCLSQGVSDGSWHPDTQNAPSNPCLQKRASLCQHWNKEAATNNCSQNLRLLLCASQCWCRLPAEVTAVTRCSVLQGTSHAHTSCFLWSDFTSAYRLWLVSEDMPSLQRNAYSGLNKTLGTTGPFQEVHRPLLFV